MSLRWEEHLRAQGALAKVYPNDITDGKSVHSLCKRIYDELPPIEAVAQGTMALADAMFIDLDPKLNGSMNLEEIFWALHLNSLFSSRPWRAYQAMQGN